MRNKKEIWLPCHRCDLRMVPGERKCCFWLFQSPDSFWKAFALNQHEPCFHLLRYPNYFLSTGQFSREEQLPLYRAAASSAGPPSPFAAAALWAQGRCLLQKREDLELPWLLQRSFTIGFSRTEVSSLAPRLLFPTRGLLCLRPHMLGSRFLHHQILKLLVCATRLMFPSCAKPGMRKRRRSGPGLSLSPGWDPERPRAWTVLRLIFLFYSKITITETKGLSTNMGITLSLECNN